MEVNQSNPEGADARVSLDCLFERKTVEPIGLPYAPPHEHPIDGMAPFFFRYRYQHLEGVNALRHMVAEIFIELVAVEFSPRESQRKFIDCMPFLEKTLHERPMAEFFPFAERKTPGSGIIVG